MKCRDCEYWKTAGVPFFDSKRWGKCLQKPSEIMRGDRSACLSSLWTVKEVFEVCGECPHFSRLREGSVAGLCLATVPGIFVTLEDHPACDAHRGLKVPLSDVEEGKISEAQAQGLWQEYLAKTVERLEAEEAKKNRRWGIHHEKYGWLGTGSGADFVTSKKKDARREAVKWLERYGWKIKRYRDEDEED